MKYIVDALNQTPFNKKYSLIAFDSLDASALKQVLNDVLTEISPEEEMDLREETPDQTAYRMLSLLRVLKYQPEDKSQAGLSNFRQGVVQGSKAVIYHLLQWLLQNLSELKKRAYLAKYLIPIEVPAEILQEEGMEEVYEQYKDLLEQFKSIHKITERNKSSSFSVSEIRRDITSMEEEKSKILKRIERLEKKASDIPNGDKLLEASRRLRKEKNREVELGETLQEQQHDILMAQHKIERLSLHLRDLQSASSGSSVEAVTAKLEEENRLNRNLLQETLEKKLEVQSKTCMELESVLSDPATNEADLAKIQEQTDEANREADSLMEKHMAGNDPMMTKLRLFRQQATIIANKRQTAQGNYKSSMDELAQAEAELKAKQEQLKEMGGEMLKEDEFKKYCAKLRSLNNTYKAKKTEVNSLKAECGVLSRTEAVLQLQCSQVKQKYSELEEEGGVIGFNSAQEDLQKVSEIKGEYDGRKEKSLQDMALALEKLNEKIASKKASLAPLIREQRPLKEQDRELSASHAEKKSVYESMSANLESKRAQLEHEVRVYQEECIQLESRYHYLHTMKKVLSVQQQQIATEMKAYTVGEPGKTKTLRDQFTRKIQEQENVGRALKDKKKEVAENHPFAVKQVKMWMDLKKVLECKKICLQQSQVHKAQAAAAQQAILAQEDRLIIS